MIYYIMDRLLRKYYGKNYDKAMENAKEERAKMKEEFLKKYPNADLSKFEFDVDLNQDGTIDSTSIFFKNSDVLSTDITSDTFLKDRSMTKYLYSNNNPLKVKQLPTKLNKNGTIEENNKFPLIWQSNGTIQKIPESNVQYVEGYRLTDKYPDHYILDYDINDFKIYMNNRDYFPSKLPKINITTDYNKADWDDNESYYQVCFAVYCASYCCGVSIEHLTPSKDVHPIITSLMRFHLYFTVRRLIRRMQGGGKMSAISREFSAGEFYRNIEHIRRNMIYRTRGGVVYQLFPSTLHNNYKRCVPVKSNGLTKIGMQ